jgi:ribosomal protein S12 methylthiotransferase
VDEVGAQGASARSAADAPQIDGVVHIEPAPGLRAGEFVAVEIVAADAYDLTGRLVP